MNSALKRILAATLLASTALLTACGGGDNKSNPTVTDDPGIVSDNSGDSGENTPVSTAAPMPVKAKAIFQQNSGNYRYYRIKVEYGDNQSSEFMESIISYSKEKAEQMLDQQVGYVNAIANANTDVNFYVFAAERFDDTPMLSEYIPEEYDKHEMFLEFFDKLDDRIQYDWLHLDTLEDRLSKVYLTDHHWTPLGIDEGYHRIAAMVKNNYPDMPEPLEVVDKYDIDVKYFGNRTRLTSYYKLYDSFSIWDYHMPEHTVTGCTGFEERIKPYLNGTYSTDRSYDHYENFYGCPSKITYTNNNYGRNMLIIGDSYSRGVIELVANCFDNTYLLYYSNRSGFDYNSFIEKYDITDVMILHLTQRLIYDSVGDCNFSTIKLK